MKLKDILKTIKLNESTISMFLGALVIIIVGVLVVNYFKESGKNILPFLTDKKTEQVDTSNNTHTVVKGDTLWAISEKYYGTGYVWTDIAKANNLTNANKIEEGQKLILPVIEKVAGETISEVTNAKTISTDTYTVVHGDNLWDIAVRSYGNGYKWVEIAKANKLVNPNVIHSGNVLVLPR